MSEFNVSIVRIDSVERHPDADRLSLVRIAGFISVSGNLEDGSFRYKAGDLIAYIPEAAILPEWMLKKLDFWKDGKGTLAGSRGDRVKAAKLRGIVSQGILYPVEKTPSDRDVIELGDTSRVPVFEGQDVASLLGIIKYEPPIPVSMQGEVLGEQRHALKYDIESYQKYGHIFEDGEPVVVTEKLHGTCCCLAYDPESNHGDLYEKKFFASSKGMLSRGMILKHNEKNAGNLYHRFLMSKNKEDVAMTDILQNISENYDNLPVYVFGEIFGRGIQDLTYGLGKPEFRVFDVYVGKAGEGRFLDHDELEWVVTKFNLDRVPVLYVGKFSKEKMVELRDGNTNFLPDGAAGSPIQIREGVVIRSAKERKHNLIGRTQLKFISPDYLLRKGETTEFQ